MDFQKLVIKTLLQHLKERFDESEPQKMRIEPGPKSKDRRTYDACNDHLKAFLEFAQAYLDKYPAMTTMMLERGFGCTLSDGQPVTLSNAQELQPMRDEGLGFTQGRGNSMQPSGSIQFGNR